MAKKRRVDPIPEEFASHEEAAEFWDTHDTTHYSGQFRTVPVTSELRRRRYEIEIDADVIKKLRSRARRKRIPASRLANELLRQRLNTGK
ncbi:MAG TPA: CopG family antitoxin [Blastocatellia bacterium]|nr:CopG family antitoxin [Blastocatellia bacterium]